MIKRLNFRTFFVTGNGCATDVDFNLQREFTNLRQQVEKTMNHNIVGNLITDKPGIENILNEIRFLHKTHQTMLEEKEKEKIEHRRNQYRESQRRYRASLSPSSKAAVQKSDRDRMAEYRKNMTPQQKEKVRADDRLRKAKKK